VVVTGTGTGRRTGGCRPAEHASRHADKNTDRAGDIPAASPIRPSVCHAGRYRRESDLIGPARPGGTGHRDHIRTGLRDGRS